MATTRQMINHRLSQMARVSLLSNRLSGLSLKLTPSPFQRLRRFVASKPTGPAGRLSGKDDLSSRHASQIPPPHSPHCMAYPRKK